VSEKCVYAFLRKGRLTSLKIDIFKALILLVFEPCKTIDFQCSYGTFSETRKIFLGDPVQCNYALKIIPDTTVMCTHTPIAL